MSRIVLALCLALVPAVTRAAAVRPADVLAEVTANLSPAEVARWERGIGPVIPGVKLPAQDQIFAALGKAVGASSLAGLDLGKPVRILLLDPKRYPNPAVLVGQGKPAQLKAALLDSPAVTMKVRGNTVAPAATAAAAVCRVVASSPGGNRSSTACRSPA